MCKRRGYYFRIARQEVMATICSDSDDNDNDSGDSDDDSTADSNSMVGPIIGSRDAKSLQEMAIYVFGTLDTFNVIRSTKCNDFRIGRYVWHLTTKITQCLDSAERLNIIFDYSLRLEEFEVYFGAREPSGYLFSQAIVDIFDPPEIATRLVEAILLDDASHIEW